MFSEFSIIAAPKNPETHQHHPRHRPLLRLSLIPRGSPSGNRLEPDSLECATSRHDSEFRRPGKELIGDSDSNLDLVADNGDSCWASCLPQLLAGSEKTVL